jgi:hypothetical protein
MNADGGPGRLNRTALGGVQLHSGDQLIQRVPPRPGPPPFYVADRLYGHGTGGPGRHRLLGQAPALTKRPQKAAQVDRRIFLHRGRRLRPLA